MQAAGQYGPSELQQFMVGRGTGPHARMFSLAHDVAMPTGGAHRQHQQQQQHQTQEQVQNHQTQIQQPHPQSHQQQSQPNPPHHIQSQQQLQNYQQQQQVDQPLELSSDSPAEPHSQPSSRPSQRSFEQLTSTRDSLANDDGMEEDEKGSGANRWPREESLALIKIRSDMDSSFKDSGLKGPLWEEVSRKLAELGYDRSAKKCKEKFENVHKYYKKTKDGRAGRQDGKNYRFFSQLEALYGGTAYGSGWGFTSGTSGAGTGSRLENTTPSKEGRGLLLTSDRVVEIVPRSQGPAAVNEDIISSDFSEDDYDESGDAHQPESKNRKRKSWMSQMLLFENVLKKFVDKQETMHRKFLEAFERREQERLIREEVWKRQEAARMNRDLELRAQERSLATRRDAALVAFLQKVTGQTLQFPPAPPTAGAPFSKPTEISTSNQAEQKQVPDPNNRWPKAEVLALIRLRSDMEARFQEPGPKGALWEEIGKGMSSLGYNRNAKRCKEKWENINKYFRKTKESNKKRSEDAKTCPYFHQLDTLYRTGVLNAPTGKPLKTEDQAAEILDRPAESNKGHRGHARGEPLTILPSDEGHPQVANDSNAPQAQIHSAPDKEVIMASEVSRT
ncbi:hypothetical protein O6H91_Y118500 [Diphasiastrum complanatum]|nr:hypothetical protein O6H91_Y118500 [Diphasiastrum complanatum]KAJ7296505.1 hypothetical protein O6H91_Y118500 [Diphasiastrum complanatum]